MKALTTGAGSRTSASANAGPASFEELVQHAGARLYRTALLLSGDHHLAEDLTQTALAKVFASWRRVRAANDPLAYSRAVLVRTWLSHRRLRSSSERPTDAVPELPAAPIDHETRLDVREALCRLDVTDRAVLVLRYFDDLDVATTSRLTGLSEAAVRKRCQRALARLREQLPGLRTEDDGER